MRELNADLDARAQQLEERLTRAVDDRVAATTARIASGSLQLTQTKLRSGSDQRAERGRHRFAHPFRTTPSIVFGLRVLDLPRSDRPRVAVNVLRVDPHGFDYEIRTWGKSTIWDATADWVAYTNGIEPAAPAAALAR